MAKIGIIGGSGLDDPKLLDDYLEKEVETPYGKPSSKITCGKIQGVEVCIIARHGKKHDIPPTNVNFRANIQALKQERCTHILATTAVGSLREEIKPGDLVFPNQFIDFTKQRKMTFHDKDEVVHTPMAEPYNKELIQLLSQTATELNFQNHINKTIITIEGPRFSTKAESHMFRQWEADIINMSTCPEIILANELEIPYATIAMSTDYDCWKEDEEPVTFEMVMKTMKENAEKVKKLLLEIIPKLGGMDEEFIKSKIRTIPDFPKPGIMFRDITTLLADPEGMERVVEILYDRYKDKNIHKIAGIESRGFIIGGILANKLQLPFIPIRKPGKLPAETISQEYELEYGTDKVEIHKDAVKKGDNVLLVDDLVATSGTALASCELIQKLEGKIEEIAFIIELEDLGGRKKLEDKGHKVFSIVKFEESG